MSRPNVSILICTRDRADDLRQTLDAIGQVRVREEITAEVIVIDNASADQTSNVANRAILANAIPVRCVTESRPGKGYAYNRGMAAARGDVLLFTDDDVRPPTDWIEGMCGPILRGEADAVAGGVRLAPHLERPWLTDFLRVWVACTDGIDSDHPTSMVGANMAFSRKVLERVPAFDPELGPGALGFDDEAMFAWQLLEAGYRLLAAPDV